jgi:flagellar hook-length control protein FliK
VVTLESNSSSSSSKSQNDTSRDQGSENFKADLLRANLTKKPDSLASKSSVLDAEEMKANMDKLVQKAKIQIINEGRSQAEIRLNPMELGRIILKISVQNDKVQGKVLVDSEAVKTALQNDLSTLKEDLRAQGLDLQSLSIDVNLDFNQDLQGRQDQFAKIDNFGNRNRKESLVDIEVPKTIRVSDSLLDVIA